MKKWLYISSEEYGIRNLDFILIITILPTLFYYALKIAI